MKIHFTTLFLPAAAALVLSACSSIPSRQASSLPIHAGKVFARASETGSTLYVSGSVPLPTGRAIHHAAHVDIQLVSASGKILAERRDSVDASHPRLSRARSGRSSFVASFPMSEARAAAKIRVIYHGAGHAGPA